MKSIERQKQYWADLLAARDCKLSSSSMCNKKVCECVIAGELISYLKAIIPSPYERYTIYDFHGKSSDFKKELVDPEILKKAKSKIIEYCWGKNITLDDILVQDKDLDKYSVMDARRREGRNVVIYASSYDEGNKKPLKKGRTMVASIIMKEAIKRRVINNEETSNFSNTYEWIGFPSLVNILTSKDNNGAIAVYENCDWLVVDGVKPGKFNEKATDYINNVIDPFFTNRVDNGKPTIITMKANLKKLSERYDLSDVLGTGIAGIIESGRTCKIALS